MAKITNIDSLLHATCHVEGVREVRGDLDATGLRVGIVAGRFHSELTSALAGGLVQGLLDRGAKPDDILVVWVPGTFEVSCAIERLARARSFDVLIALGAVVQGETSHAEMIVASTSDALCEISRQGQIPVIDGVVSAPSYEQARARCVPGPDSRARYLADAATEVARVHQKIPKGIANG